MNKLKALLFAWMVALTLGVQAAPLTLDFEDIPLTDGPTLVGNRYVGLGVTFSDNAYMAVSNGVCVNTSCSSIGWGAFIAGPNDFTGDIGAVLLASSTYVGGNPGCSTANCVAFSASVTGGFGTSFSFDIGGTSGATVEVLDASGKVLQSESTGKLGDLCDGDVCNWTHISLSLGDATASSIMISSADGVDWFDNMSFGALPTVGGGGDNGLPEPNGVALAFVGFGALAVSRRRRVR